MKVHTVCNMQVAVISSKEKPLFKGNGVKRQLVRPGLAEFLTPRESVLKKGMDQKLYTTMSQLGVL